MSLHGGLLAVHIIAGVLGLILGPIAMGVRKRPGLHPRLGEIYHWNYVAMAGSAAGLAILGWNELWWFLPIAIGSYGFALWGYLAAKRRWRGWLYSHLSGQGGSYIAMVTALLVVNIGVGVWWTWVLPTLLGTPLISWVSREVARGRRPAH